MRKCDAAARAGYQTASSLTSWMIEATYALPCAPDKQQEKEATGYSRTSECTLMRARTYGHTHLEQTSKRREMLKAVHTHTQPHTQIHTHGGRQVFQHITGSVAHIGMDYHIVTLRLTPTDNKLERDVRWGRREGAAERTWREAREEEETDSRALCSLFLSVFLRVSIHRRHMPVMYLSSCLRVCSL